MVHCQFKLAYCLIFQIQKISQHFEILFFLISKKKFSKILLAYIEFKKFDNTIWIVKPGENSNRGKGIYITN